MKFYTAAQHRKLLKNGSPKSRDIDHYPVVKLFTPGANSIWLISEINPDDYDVAFGLYDLGHGCPMLGTINLAELDALRGPLGLSVERDLHFEAIHPLSMYASIAWSQSRIMPVPTELQYMLF